MESYCFAKFRSYLLGEKVARRLLPVDFFVVDFHTT